MGPAASLAFSVYIALINLARAGKHGHGSSAVSAGTVCWRKSDGMLDEWGLMKVMLIKTAVICGVASSLGSI